MVGNIQAPEEPMAEPACKEASCKMHMLRLHWQGSGLGFNSLYDSIHSMHTAGIDASVQIKCW